MPIIPVIAMARSVKRAADVILSAAALMLLAPLMAVIAVAVRCRIGSPVLFRQTRPGLDARPFTIYKFRTMTSETDSDGSLLRDAERLTCLGGVLRATSLDELPELWNVLTGDMSLVGPRPLLMQYLPLYTEVQMRRHAVRPGITGLSQVMGRNSLTWEQKFDLDLWYIDRWSLRLDLWILRTTVTAVLRREGISREGHATMPEFTGSPRLS